MAFHTLTNGSRISLNGITMITAKDADVIVRADGLEYTITCGNMIMAAAVRDDLVAAHEAHMTRQMPRQIISELGLGEGDEGDLGPAVPMDFSEALWSLKDGDLVQRSGWNGVGMWLMLQTPDGHSLMSLPYIYMKTADHERVPWLASQTDLLADDWMVV